METPYNFDKTANVADLLKAHESLDDGSGSGVTASVAGRLMLRRDQGKIAFGVLQDSSGRIQLFAPSKITPDFERFVALNLGDWIGVTGEVMKTKRGELSVKVPSSVDSLKTPDEPEPEASDVSSDVVAQADTNNKRKIETKNL